jgi:hypothetical protein
LATMMDKPLSLNAPDWLEVLGGIH